MKFLKRWFGQKAQNTAAHSAPSPSSSEETQSMTSDFSHQNVITAAHKFYGDRLTLTLITCDGIGNASTAIANKELIVGTAYAFLGNLSAASAATTDPILKIANVYKLIESLYLKERLQQICNGLPSKPTSDDVIDVGQVPDSIHRQQLAKDLGLGSAIELDTLFGIFADIDNKQIASERQECARLIAELDKAIAPFAPLTRSVVQEMGLQIDEDVLDFIFYLEVRDTAPAPRPQV